MTRVGLFAGVVSVLIVTGVVFGWASPADTDAPLAHAAPTDGAPVRSADPEAAAPRIHEPSHTQPEAPDENTRRIPTPSSLLLFGVGAIGLVVYEKRRHTRAVHPRAGG